MSVIRVNVFSNSLLRTVDLTVILPVEKHIESGRREYKTLYLLHGVLGSDIDWLHGTRVKMWADEYNVAVVMPSAENSCYVNDYEAHRLYSDFIGQELVDITRHMFPLSTKREDTFIAGLSMGGFGALNLGLKYKDTFSHIGTLSLALIPELQDENGAPFATPTFFSKVFGCTVEENRMTENDPRYLIENLEGQVPNIYVTCGTEDFVLEGNKLIHEHLNAHNINHEFVLEPGIHDWYFWDKKLLDFLKWLPLDKTQQAVGSGQVPIEN